MLACTPGSSACFDLYLLRCYSGYSPGYSPSYSPCTRIQHNYADTAHAYVGGGKFGSTHCSDCEERYNSDRQMIIIVGRVFLCPALIFQPLYCRFMYVYFVFIIGLVVCVLLPCSTLHLLFIPFLLTVLVPVIRTLLVTTVCMALIIVSLIHLITLLLVI